jgi:putative membrane protein
LLATVAGLAVAVWVLGQAGWAGVLAAVARIGVGGFVLFCLWFVGVFLLLGAAWWSAAPDEPVARLGLFAWARMVREAASDLLPFSQLGGLVLGARTLISRGVPQRRANAALLVDMTTERAAQLVFTLAGIALFLATVTAGPEAVRLRSLIFGGTVVMLAAMAAFFVAQRTGLGLAGRLAARVLPGADDAADAIGEELRAIYARRRAVALSFLFNLLAWLGSATGAWLALRLMGVPASFWAMLMVESLIFTLRSVAFAIPGALGVQEVGYLLLAPVAGIAPEAMLALSLVKRARDLALGLPTLVAWQLGEVRAVARHGRE